MPPNDPIETLWVELAVETDKMRKTIKDELAKTKKQVETDTPPINIPVKVDPSQAVKDVNKQLDAFKKNISKSLGVLALMVDTKPTEAGIKQAVALFEKRMPELKKLSAIELRIETDKLKKDIEDATKLTTNQLNGLQAQGQRGPGIDYAKKLSQDLSKTVIGGLVPMQQAVKTTNNELATLGRVGLAAGQSLLTAFLQTGNPIVGLTSGIQALSAGLQGMAGASGLAAGGLMAVVAPIAAVVAGLLALTAAGKPVVDFLVKTGTEGQQMAVDIETAYTGLSVAAKNFSKDQQEIIDQVDQLRAIGIRTGDAIESMMQFLTNQVPTENIDDLAAAAQDMGVAFHKDSTTTFGLFNHAIQTVNTTVLQQIGIQKTATQMQEEYADALGINVNNLTYTQQRLAVINGIMQAASGYTGVYEKSLESIGKRITTLPRIISEATIAFGQTLTPFLAQQVASAESFWKKFQRLFVQMKTVMTVRGPKEVADTTEAGQPIFTKLGQQIFTLASQITGAIQPIMDALMGALPVVGSFFEQAVSGTKKFAIGLGVLLTPLSLLTKALVILGSFAWDGVADGVDIVVKKLTIYSSGLELLQGGMTALGQITTIFLAGAAGGFAELGFMLDEVYKKLKGEGGNYADWKEFSDAVTRAGDEAAKGVVDAFMGMGEEIAQAPPIDVSTMTPGPVVSPDWAQKQQQLKDFGKAVADTMDGIAESIAQANKSFNRAMRDFDRDSQRQFDKMDATFTKQGERMARDAGTRRTIMERDYQKSVLRGIQDFEKDAATQKEDIQKQSDKQQALEKERFLLEMRRMDEDYTDNLEGLVERRDARGIRNLIKQHAKEKSRRLEDFDDQKRIQKQQLDDQFKDIDDKRQDMIDKMALSYVRQKEDYEQSLLDQRDAAAQSYSDQVEDFMANQELLRAQRKEDHDQQMTDMDDDNKERLEKQVQAWADAGIIDQEGAAQVFKNLDDYYGAGGKIENLVNDFIKRMSRNKKIEITVKTGAQGSTNNDDTGNGSRIPTKQSGGPRHRALGGLDVVDRPTMSGDGSTLYGEGGREAHLYVPINTTHSPLQQIAQLLGRGGSKRSDRLSVDLRVTANGDLPAGAADKLYLEIAKMIAAQVGVRVEESD